MIYIDPRRGSAELIHLIESHGAPCQISATNMPAADFAFSGSGPNGGLAIGIERKTIRDLLQSTVRDTRLPAHQLPGMHRLYDWSGLLVEGVYRPDPATGIIQEYRAGHWQDITLASSRFTETDVEKLLMSLAIQGGLWVWRTRNQQHTAATLCRLYSWWAKPWEKHSTFHVFHDVQAAGMITPPTLVRRVAKELPGIGWERSKAVEEVFPNVEAMALADEPAWRAVTGIGKGIARSVWRAIRGVEE